ncbi:MULTISPECIES: GAF domain-containing protein [unclassified Microbacterium]|uniref:GAF domain-containing protein n=1 Tax=unclassified Microbacterium TaxID=2609290 RepID=UPI0021A75C0F|nr:MULTISPECIES: GAF domain-containing protein [unclassified Microbacterium]MCT1363751.1 GAF domain-containing protein [Microbacterium sp. p3-SID131]MCT1375449.1 GAF domain-containing protein [Microbacterium sp. p3-SID337]
MTDDGPGEPLAYRAPMRSRDDAVAPGVAVERALAEGVCGMGGRLDSTPGSLTAALAAVDARHGERAARRLERFAALPMGTLVWTRDVDGLFWLGRLTGPWRYDDDPAAVAADLVHVRACTWSSSPVAASDVPPGVTATFARGGRNGQRIRTDGAGEQSSALWERSRG